MYKITQGYSVHLGPAWISLDDYPADFVDFVEPLFSPAGLLGLGDLALKKGAFATQKSYLPLRASTNQLSLARHHFFSASYEFLRQAQNAVGGGAAGENISSLYASFPRRKRRFAHC